MYIRIKISSFGDNYRFLTYKCNLQIGSYKLRLNKHRIYLSQGESKITSQT